MLKKLIRVLFRCTYVGCHAEPVEALGVGFFPECPRRISRRGGTQGDSPPATVIPKNFSGKVTKLIYINDKIRYRLLPNPQFVKLL
jgi:hypothetical protein